MKTLLLNADYSPMDMISLKKAILMSLGFNDKPVYVLEYYPKTIRDSAGRVYPVPAVIVLKNYCPIDVNKATYNKVNIFYRDKFICQYCAKQFKRVDLTVDHVIPKSRWKALGHKGTSSCYENIVTCCKTCNTKKANRTPKESGMNLINQPKKITRRQVFLNKLEMVDIPEKWIPYLESSNVKT